MKKTGDKVFDFLYNIMDYIIIIGILAIVILVISMKLDILFEDDTYAKPVENTTQLESSIEELSENPSSNNNTNTEITDSGSTNSLTETSTEKTSEEQNEESNVVSIGSVDSVEGESQSNSGDLVKITIPSGSATLNTGKILLEKGLIKDAKEFETRAIETGFDRKIKAGSFEIAKGTSLDEILKIISKTK